MSKISSIFKIPPKPQKAKWTYRVERKKVAHATNSCYQKGKDKLSIEIRTNWKLSCPTQ